MYAKQHSIARVRRLIGSAAGFAVCAIVNQCFAAINPTPFTPNNPIGGAPIGWAYAGNKFIGSILDNNGINQGQNLLYSTDLTGNNVQPFGGTVTLAPNYGLEHYVSSSIGLGGFPVGDVFVASGNNIQRISNAGVAYPGLFVNGSTGGINGSVRGITFDAVGTFGNKMIVTTHTGFVYTVDSLGNATQIASTGEDTEGLDIAPLGGNWPGMNGWLFVASEGGAGTIRAIKPNTFAMTTVATNVASAEELDFVPLVLGSNPLEGLYGANYSFNVLHAGANQFLGKQGDIILTGETNSSIYDLNFTNGLTTVGAFPNQPEDGLFVTANLIALDNVPEPATFTLLGMAGLMCVRRPRRA